MAGGTAVVLAMGLLSGLGLLAASPAAANTQSTSTASPSHFPGKPPFPGNHYFPSFARFKTTANATAYTDTATLTGNSTNGSPTGTVSFYVCGPLQHPWPGFCAPFFNKPQLVSADVTLTPGADNTSTATSGTFNATVGDYYCFGAVYSGGPGTVGGTYFPDIDNVWWFHRDNSECFTAGTAAAPPSPTITGALSQAGPFLGTASPVITDTATITGSDPPATNPDDVAPTFDVCVGTEGPCSPGTSVTPVTSPVTTTGNSAPYSFTASVSYPSQPASATDIWYCFSISYAGDANYGAAALNTDANTLDNGQCFEIGPAAPPPPPSPAGGGGGSSSPSGPGLFRLGGADRIATAALISQASYGAGKAGAVILSTSDNFPDAVAATPLALKYNAPILLTPPTSLDPRTAAEIKRVLPAGGTVYVLGGTDAVSAAVANAVTALGYTVVRIGGATRFDTAVDIANQVGGITRIFLADGDDFSDVLSAAAASGHPGTVVALTDNETLPTVTSDFLQANPTASVYDIGGPAAVAAPGVTTIVGTDRFQTSALVAQEFFNRPTGAGLATGLNFPDALAAGPFLARNGWPLLLTEPGSLPPSVSEYLTAVKSSLTSVDVLGGVDVVSQSVVQAIDTILGIPTSG